MSHPSHPSPPAPRPVAWLFVGLGCFFVALGAIGVVLPVLPTTPLLLLAAACFARGSRRLHARLLNSRLFGPTIRAWQETRSIPRGAKVTAIILIVAAFSSTIVFAISHPALRIGLAVLGLGLITYLWRIPTRRAVVVEVVTESEPGG